MAGEIERIAETRPLEPDTPVYNSVIREYVGGAAEADTSALGFREDVVLEVLQERLGLGVQPATKRAELYVHDASRDAAALLRTGSEDELNELLRQQSERENPVQYITQHAIGDQLKQKDFTPKPGHSSSSFDIAELPAYTPLREHSDDYYLRSLIGAKFDNSINSRSGPKILDDQYSGLPDKSHFGQDDPIASRWYDRPRGAYDVDGYPGPKTLESVCELATGSFGEDYPVSSNMPLAGLVGIVDPALLQSVPSLHDPEGWRQGIELSRLSPEEIGAVLVDLLKQHEAQNSSAAQQTPDAQ